MVCRQGLLVEDIEAGAGEVSGLEGVDEGGFVYELTTTAVDEERARFHQCKLASADDVAAVRAEADVKADDVGLLQELVALNEFDAKLLGAFGRGVVRPCEAFHAEGIGNTGDLATDVACADDADGAALERYVLHEGPASGLELDGLEGGALGGGEHEADDVLGDDGSSATGLVADDDAELMGDLDVDHVNADGAGGDHPKAGKGAEGFSGPLDGAACVDDDVGIPRTFKLLFHVRRAVDVEDDVTVGIEAVEMRRALNLWWVIAGDDEFWAGVRHGD